MKFLQNIPDSEQALPVLLLDDHTSYENEIEHLINAML